MSVHNSGMEKTETGREPDAERRESQEAERMGQQRPRRKGPEGKAAVSDKVVTAGLENMLRGGRRGRQRGCTGSIINEDPRIRVLVRDQLWRVWW